MLVPELLFALINYKSAATAGYILLSYLSKKQNPVSLIETSKATNTHQVSTKDL
jgi:hypothetical protein